FPSIQGTPQVASPLDSSLPLSGSLHTFLHSSLPAAASPLFSWLRAWQPAAARLAGVSPASPPLHTTASGIAKGRQPLAGVAGVSPASSSPLRAACGGAKS